MEKKEKKSQIEPLVSGLAKPKCTRIQHIQHFFFKNVLKIVGEYSDPSLPCFLERKQ